MKTETWTLFPFLTMDYKAAEVWLNQKAAQGWQYTSKTTLWGYLFRLRRTERTDLRYCVDISGGKKDQDYRDFLNQAGWGWEGTVRGMDIFSSLPGADPVPIQTDAGLERQRFGRRYFWRTWLSELAVILLVMALIVWFYGYLISPTDLPLFFLSILSSWWDLLRLALLPIFLVSVLWELTALPLYYFRSRRDGLPDPDSRRAWRRGVAEFAVSMLIKLILILNLILSFLPDSEYRYSQSEREGLRDQPVITAEEVGLIYAGYAMDSVHTSTPLVNRWEYLELVDCDSTWSLFLYTRRYHCLWEGLAVRAAQALMEDDPFTPVDLGFDESWIFRPDPPDDYSILALREGRTTVRLEGPLDWTDESVRGILEEKFGETTGGHRSDRKALPARAVAKAGEPALSF